MRRVWIAVGAALALAVCSQALADQLKLQPAPSGGAALACAQTGSKVTTAQGGGGGAGRPIGTADRKAGGEQRTVGPGTTGAGAGAERACASGQHKPQACATGEH